MSSRGEKPNFENGVVYRIVQGIGAGIIGQFLGVAQRLLLPPLFLKAWGVGMYGDWLLVSAMVSHLALAEFGGTVYVINRLTQLYARRDEKEFGNTLQTSLGLFTALPAVIIFFFISALYLAPDAWLYKFQFLNFKTYRLIISVLALQIFLSIPQALILGIYRALGKLPRGAMIANCMMFIQLILVGLGLNIQLGQIEIALLQMVPIGATLIWAMYDLNLRWPELNMFSRWRIDLSLAKGILVPSSHFFLIQFSMALSIQGTVIVAGLLMGATHVVIFSTMRTLANSIKSILGVISHAAWPDLTRLDAEADFTRLNILFRSILRTNICATVLFGYILMEFGDWIYQIWLGNLGLFDSSLMTLVIIFLTLQISSGVYSNLLMATNRHQPLSILTIISSGVSILLAYFGALHNGLDGMLHGLILAELLPTVAIPYLAYRSFCFIKPSKAVLDMLPLAIIPILYYKPLTAVFLLPALAWWWWSVVGRFLTLKFKDQKGH